MYKPDQSCSGPCNSCHIPAFDSYSLSSLINPYSDKHGYGLPIDPLNLKTQYEPELLNTNQTDRYDKTTPPTYSISDSEKTYGFGPDVTPKGILDIYHDIFGTDNSGKGIYLVDKDSITDIYGNEINPKEKGLSQFLDTVYDTAAMDPERGFCATFNDKTGRGNDQRFVYAPKKDENTYWLTLAEEMFHAVDGLKSYDASAKEAAAVFGRYLVTRYLEDKNQISLPGEYYNDIVTALALGIPTIDDTKTQDIFSELKYLYPGKEYSDRLWLHGYLENLNSMSYKEAIESLSDTYRKIMDSSDPLEAIKDVGKSHGTESIKDLMADPGYMFGLYSQYDNPMTMTDPISPYTDGLSYITNLTKNNRHSIYPDYIVIEDERIMPLGGITGNRIDPMKYSEEQMRLVEESTHTF